MTDTRLFLFFVLVLLLGALLAQCPPRPVTGRGAPPVTGGGALKTLGTTALMVAPMLLL